MTRPEALVQLRRIARRIPGYRGLLEEIAAAVDSPAELQEDYESARIIREAREMVHARTREGEAGPELVLIIKLANRLEASVTQALALEAFVHEATKGGAA